MNYWTKRAEILEKQTFQVAKKKYKEVDEAFSKAEAKIKKEIDTWYQRLADNNEITLEDAKKLLDKDELKEFKWNVDEYIKYGQENALNQKWIKELENASAKFHIRKYEAELINIKAEYEKAFNEEQKKVESAIKDSYEDRYDHTAYELQKSIGIGFDVSKKDSNQIDKLIKRPWAPDGKDFSERIWNKKDQIINTLQRELVNSILVGGGNKDEVIKMMTKYVRNDIKNAKYCASRLIMTECSYFASVGQKDCFKDLDVEKYEIVATLDNKTSHICQEMDGKVFDMKDYEPGITAPPFHVFCRSTTAPYFDDEEAYGERVARDHEGNIYYVPSDMTYGEWKIKQKELEESGFKLRNNLPRNYIDKRKVGDKISQEELDKFLDYATKNKIQIGTVDNKTGGFEEYHGNIKVLYEYIDKLSDYGFEKVILKYDNVLGYNDDKSAIDIGAFAETKGNTIKLNKFMFDDTDFMIKSYDDSAKNGIFVKGSTYLNIIDHEVMHLKPMKSKGKKIVNKFIAKYGKKEYNIKKFIVNNVSIYGALINDFTNELYELASELNVVKNVDIDKYYKLTEN